MTQKLIQLNDGMQVPSIGFGTFQIWNLDEAQSAVEKALSLGYRLIDTAAGYFNEVAVGRAMRNSSVARSQVILTTKLWPTDASYVGAKHAIQRSLEQLNTDYIDVYLIHQAFGDYYGAWRAMREYQKKGVLRSIGVSNFSAERLTDLATYSGMVPAIDQIERHPYCQRTVTVATAQRLGTTIEAWSPLAQAKSKILTDKILTEIAANHSASSAQIMLAWQMQQQQIVIPKTIHDARMVENLAAQNLVLTANEIDQISALNRDDCNDGPINSADLLPRILQIDPEAHHQQ